MTTYTKTQIGVYVVYEAFDHTDRGYETASAYTTIRVEPGAYPVCVYTRWGAPEPGKVLSSTDHVYVNFTGVCVAGYYNNRIGRHSNPNGAWHVGDVLEHSLSDYVYNVAKEILGNPDSPYRLSEDFRARASYAMHDVRVSGSYDDAGRWSEGYYVTDDDGARTQESRMSEDIIRVA